MTDEWSVQPPSTPPTAAHSTPPVADGPHWSPPGPPPPHPAPAPPPAGRRGGRRFLATMLVLALLLAGGFAVGRLTVDDGTGSASSSGDDTAVNTIASPQIDTDAEEPVAEVAAAVGPAVVKIETGVGIGSGVVYDESGLVLTNAHVVGGTDAVTVQFADGSTASGEVVGADTNTDVAVVSVDPGSLLAVAELALGAEVRVGQLAVAIGSPFELDQTVTSGIISAVDRPFSGDPDLPTVGMLQTDAPINSGNSGGALVDRHGRVIGINTAIFSNTGDNSGIGFAIPIDIAHGQAEKILGGEPLDTGFLGIGGEPTGTGDSGVLVTSVTAGSAADDAGLEVGDVVLSIDGEELEEIGELAVEVSARQPGDEVELEVTRGGDSQTMRVTLGSR